MSAEVKEPDFLWEMCTWLMIYVLYTQTTVQKVDFW